MNYETAIDWLYSTQTFGIRLGLDNMERLIGELELSPQLTATKVVHVAGTNGKGSVCAFTERILRDAGLTVGLFTSPHLVSYRERIQVGGEPIDEASVARLLTELSGSVSEWETHPTFFELSLALALRYFRENACEVVILETGMGGRLDATNAVLSDVSVITPIGLDHQQWLGETIREIAAEKAGILKLTVPVIVADLDPEARDVVGRKALSMGIPYIEAHPLPLEWELGLKGPHQRENAALAVEAACRIEGDRLTQDGIQQSLAATTWPGRFQQVSDKIVLDGAHNPAAAAALRQTWQEVYSDEKVHLIFGAAESKDVVGVLAALLPIVAAVSFVPIRSERRLSGETMRTKWIEAGGESIPITEEPELEDAIEAAAHRTERTLLAGSLFLVGEALAILQKSAFEVSAQ